MKMLKNGKFITYLQPDYRDLIAEKKVPAREHEHSFVRQKLGSDHEVKGVAGFPTWQCECGEKIKAS